MKITNRQLDTLGGSDAAKKFYSALFPVVVSWRIKLQREVLKDASKVLSEMRRELALRYCTKNADGSPLLDADRFTFRGVEATRFAVEFNELLDEELEIGTDRVDISESVFDAAGRWSANDLDALAPFINIIMPESAA